MILKETASCKNGAVSFLLAPLLFYLWHAPLLCWQGAKGDKLSSMAENLKYYPLIFVASWSVNTVLRVVQAVHPEYKNNYEFNISHVIFHG
jgi:hypothetical protein